MDELCRLIAKVLQVPPELVGPETGPANQAKWDSFHHVHVVMAVEEKYGIEMALEEIATLLSVGEIAEKLRSKGIELPS